jgi:hypothetical protein
MGTALHPATNKENNLGVLCIFIRPFPSDLLDLLCLNLDLTPLDRTLFEKLIVAQLVRNDQNFL